MIFFTKLRGVRSNLVKIFQNKDLSFSSTQSKFLDLNLVTSHWKRFVRLSVVKSINDSLCSID